MKRIVRKLMDQEMEATIGQLLRVGVLSSAAVVAIGGAVYLVRHYMEMVNYGVFRRQPPELSGLDGIILQALSGRGRGIIQMGLLILIATPVARVIFSVFGFVKERDWLYVGVTLIVLTILCYSLFTG